MNTSSMAPRASQRSTSPPPAPSWRDFTYIEPYPPKPPVAAGQKALSAIENKAKEASARFESGDLRTKVVKSYPTTTHARTVEYRLSDRESLSKLFKSIEDAWLNGRAGSFKP